MFWVWYFKRIMHFTSLFMLFLFYFLPPLGLSCHKKSNSMMYLDHAEYKEFLYHARQEKLFGRQEHHNQIHVRPKRHITCPNGSTLWRPKYISNWNKKYFADLANMLCFLVIWKYRKHKNRWFVTCFSRNLHHKYAHI